MPAMNTAPNLTRFRSEMAIAQRLPEHELLPGLLESAHVDTASWTDIEALARRLTHVERLAAGKSPVTWLLHKYPLGSSAGLALLTLAECCLRVPDRHTLRLLVRDKLTHSDWQQRSQRATPLLATGVTLGLRLSKWLLNNSGSGLKPLQHAGEAVISRGILYAMRRLGEQFVFDGNIDAALRHARQTALTCSFDMLGEAARTAADADRYLDAYQQAITAVAADARSRPGGHRHSVSIKLSALHPRYEILQARRVVPELVERLCHLAQLAMNHDLELTIDAEECERLELSLDVVERLLQQSALRDWQGLNIAVQAYQKRAPQVIGWIDALAALRKRSIGVRLVKGAYWDTEIKRCQERGLHNFPVYTRKAATDVSYLACARQVLASTHLRPAFATHNALTIATLLSWIGTRRDVEFQRLHGMAANLYRSVAREQDLLCRVYAPVGPHSELLPYLIRRMLENGANSSFVQRLGNPAISAQALTENPVQVLRDASRSMPPSIALPADLYGNSRRNSEGLDLFDRTTLDALNHQLNLHREQHVCRPTVGGAQGNVANTPVRNPADPQQIVGYVANATHGEVITAINTALTTTDSWSGTSVSERCACLERMADLLEQHRDALMSLLIREAGKTRSDAMTEVREAVDFCRYYASEARNLLKAQSLPGPSGENNVLSLHARGVFACISPWNFPLAIFIGQIAAALVTGNSVIAKPAPQTPLIAALAIQLLHQCGVPESSLALLPGGPEVGDWIVRDAHIAGVAFTGSTGTARRIARALLEDEQRPLATLIAETGGINAMIVDSTALPEQVVADVITSAFQSAGQRCSALRLLCLQDDIYDSTMTLLKGAMAELCVGDPVLEQTDVGPLIDEAACKRINDYLAASQSRIAWQTPVEAKLPGWFIAPTLITIQHPQELQQEVFGPVLHVTRWQAGHLSELIDTLNASGYGLTMGLHSRLDSAAQLVRERAQAGNLYINRSMIGAVVGSQPFGGERLSGTGPKAGGPHYLLRFCTERTVSTDTTSVGGNTSLMNLEG
jgi:RHH-type transcriptional regulator, proline utilization regulon repressor / proline dehydrogenase / delta 1-pyrroline-5-carboxylate dehydrogenase